MGYKLKWMKTFFVRLFFLCVFLPLVAASTWTLVPEDSLYPPPIAEQNFPRFSLSFPMYMNQHIDTIEDSSRISLREVLEFGGAQSLFRIKPLSHNPLMIELSIGAGIIALFDSFEDNLENFGWEGSGFVTLNFKLTPQISFRFGFHHISSHMGDEYLAKYGVLNLPINDEQDLLQGETYALNYVRDSLMGGLSIHLSPFIRVYAEARYSMNMLRYMLCYNSFPWQANIGFEFQWPSSELYSKRWYLAINTSGYQESSWFPSTTIQIGRIMNTPHSNQRFRFGFEYYHGRVQIASFNHTMLPTPTSWKDLQIEQYIAIGAWYDF